MLQLPLVTVTFTAKGINSLIRESGEANGFVSCPIISILTQILILPPPHHPDS